MPISSNLRAALFMVVAMATFTSNDAITKYVLETVGMGQVLLVRGLFATLLILLLAWSSGALRRPGQIFHPVVAMRTLSEMGATLAFVAALSHMPLANISSVLQALPLAVTMGAALFFGETVGWRRWLAIAIGFSGVLVIVRPGLEGFNAFSLLALLSVMCAASRDLFTRRIPEEIPSMLVSVATAVMVSLLGGVIVLVSGDWEPLPAASTLLLAFSSILLIGGYQFIIMAMREGEISFVAPFRYTALIWALTLGFLIFGETPDLAMIVGASIIVVSGLYTLYRERRVGGGKPAAESTNPGMGPDGL